MVTPARLLMSLIVAVFLAAPAPADTTVGGMITTDTHWTAAGGPYIAAQSVLVTGEATLTIDPGVEVRFAPQTALAVILGQLVARGTAVEPIRFTRDGSAEQDRWGYIGFGDQSIDAGLDPDGGYLGGCIIEHAIVEYAGGTDLLGAIRVDHAAPLIKDCTIQQNSKCGIYGTYAQGLHVVGNDIINNFNVSADDHGGGVYMYRSEDVVLAYNRICGNDADWGGGVCFREGCYGGTLRGNEITGNTADTGGGVCLREFSHRTALMDNDISGNTANAGAGLCIYWCDEVSLTGDRVVDNVGDGILCTAAVDNCEGLVLCKGPGGPTLIYGNQGYQVFNELGFTACPDPAGPGNVDARGVWWGTMEAAQIEAGIHDFFDDAALGIVFYDPFAVAGDANLDGVVDGLDYNTWSLHYNQPGGWADGDFSGDGFVDGLDYNMWSLSYLSGSGAGGQVPEPTSAGLLILGLWVIARRRQLAT